MQKHEGYLGDLSPEQEKVLALLKEHIKANHPTPRPFDDAYLLRFCRAREFDIKKVILMFDNMMDWRKNNQVDEMHNYEFPKKEEMAKHHQHGFYFTCKAGRPVYIERMGIMDPQKILEITTKEEIVRYYTKMHEKVMWVMLPVASKAAGKPIERCTNIFDMKGFSIFKMGKKVYDLISAASSMAQNNYPELLGAYKFFMDSDKNF